MDEVLAKPFFFENLKNQKISRDHYTLGELRPRYPTSKPTKKQQPTKQNAKCVTLLRLEQCIEDAGNIKK
jgi:hypothetical protein